MTSRACRLSCERHALVAHALHHPRDPVDLHPSAPPVRHRPDHQPRPVGRRQRRRPRAAFRDPTPQGPHSLTSAVSTVRRPMLSCVPVTAQPVLPAAALQSRSTMPRQGAKARRSTASGSRASTEYFHGIPKRDRSGWDAERGDAPRAKMRENGPTVSRAAGQLPVHSMGHAPQRTRETCPQGGFPTPEGRFPGLEVVGRRPFGQAVLRRRPGPLSR